MQDNKELSDVYMITLFLATGLVKGEIKLRILVNNIRSTNSTLLVRLLKRIKRFPVEVWGTDISAPGFIASSTFVDRYFQAPSIDDDTAYLSSLQNLFNQHPIDFIFISTDKEVRFMDHHKEEIKIPFINSPHETIALLQDKLEASLSIERLGIAIPPICNNLFGESKVIFRKRRSVSSAGIYITDLATATHIENHFQADWFAQKYLTGTTYVVDMFTNRNSVPKLILPRRTIETQNGSAFRSQIVEHIPLIETCKLIYSHIQIPGLSNIEFIENADGLHFIEVNLRIGGSATAGVIASFNYIEQYLDHFVNGTPLESSPEPTAKDDTIRDYTYYNTSS